MINFKDESATISDILSEHNIGPMLDARSLLDNPFFGLMEYDGAMMCASVTSGAVRFCFADDSRQQAAALYDEHLVVVFRGMFEAICKVAARIASKDVYPKFGGATVSSWTINPLLENYSAREIIKNELGFVWNDEYCPWRSDEERTALFLFSLTTLFRFIIAHEIGHLYHEHGDKNKRKQYSGIEIDELESSTRECGFNPQARELVADRFAFDLVVDFQKAHINQQRSGEVGRILREKLAKSDYDLALFILQMIYVFFYMSEMDNWHNEKPEAWSHPPAPFRLRTICATVIEHGVLKVTEEDATRLLQHALLSSDALTAVLFDKAPNPWWLSSSRELELSSHYKTIFPLLSIWTLSGQKNWIDKTRNQIPLGK